MKESGFLKKDVVLKATAHSKLIIIKKKPVIIYSSFIIKCFFPYYESVILPKSPFVLQ